MPTPPTSPPLPAGLDWAALRPRAGVVAETQAREWLGERLGCAPPAIRIVRDARGRPHLPDHPRLDLNWSHSGDLLLVALGHGMRLGVDVERGRPRPRALQLARRYFAASEAAWLQGLAPEPRAHAFVRLWCAKEAVLKAHGHGLAFGLHKAVFAEREGALHLVACDAALGRAADWGLHEWAPAAGYRAALAWRALAAVAVG